MDSMEEMRLLREALQAKIDKLYDRMDHADEKYSKAKPYLQVEHHNLLNRLTSEIKGIQYAIDRINKILPL